MSVSTSLSSSSMASVSMDSASTYESLQPHEALIFLHIMKTAGTSLFKVVQQQYAKELTFHYVARKEGKQLEDFDRLPQETRDRLQFFHGHECYGVHERLPKPSRYITILRKPVNRVVSLYYFIHHNPKREIPEAERCPTLRSYLDARLTCVDNGQTRAIAGEAASDFAFGQCTSELLDIAKRNLSQFLMVGTTERFDESLLVLKHVLELDNILYSRTNENLKKPKIEDIDPDDIEIIKAHNQLDQELYLYANQLLDEKISQIGDKFSIEYSFFKYVNRQFSDVHLELKDTKKKLKHKHQKLKEVRQQRDQLKQKISAPEGNSSASNSNPNFWQRLRVR